jgi:LmbE family N-acetylglucosaminyl deacetylase
MPDSDFHVPDGTDRESALSRTTHLGIGAHQDDLEFMAFHGIAECLHSQDRWFGGIICTDGSGSSRTGPYAETSDDDLRKVRAREQRQAADIGRYSFVAQLNYPSSSITHPLGTPIVSDLRDLIASAKPDVIYTHNPADKHATHVRVVVAVLAAIQSLPPGDRPSALYGCEMWRGLDWMDDSEKVVMDVSGHGHLASALNGVFDSQIAGGKRYDLAVAGRRKANATLLDSHRGDGMTDAAFAMDLSPLIGKDPSNLVEFTLGFVNRLHRNVEDQLKRVLQTT